MIELVELQLPYRGNPKLKYLFWEKGEKNPVAEYILGLQGEEQEKVIDFLSHIAVAGLPNNKEQYRKLHGFKDLYELKRKPHRFLFFTLPGDRIVFTEAFAKNDTRGSERHFERADKRRIEYERQEGAKNANE